MKQLRTLRVRFALWTVGLLLGALGLFSVFVYANMSRSLLATVDETLHAIATQLIAEGGGRQLISIEDIAEEPQYERLREQGFSLRVFDAAGQIVQTYGPFQAFPPPSGPWRTTIQPATFANSSDPNAQQSMRIFTAQILVDGEILGILQVAQNLNSVQETLNALLISLLIGGPLIALAAGFGGYWLATRALAPIDRMTSTARAISAQDLSARLNLPTTDDELGRLAATLDSMLERLESAFRRERQFTADASHEMRTPLSALQVIIDSTLSRPRTAEAYVTALRDMNQEIARMAVLSEELLQLARNDLAGQPTKYETVDIFELLRDVVDSLRPVAAEKGLQLIDETPASDALIRGDRDALVRLFMNLLDNAIKYTAQGSIRVSARRSPDQELLISIRDTGAGIPPQDLPHIFDRFYRVDKSRSQRGTGLGLAIAQSTAHAHGGDIVVASELGQGTTFTVWLPDATEQVKRD